MFCRCETGFGAEPNTRTCPVCLAHPGALPVANRTAVEWTIELGLALGSEIAERAVFARKNYFYPDNPKGYQISQYDQPLCVGGRLAVPGAEPFEIGFVRAHLEEDAAKTVHVGGGTGRKIGAERSLIDFNRGGTPLVEIVTAARHPLGRAGRALPPAPAPDDRRARHLGRAHGGGDAPLRRQRLGAAGRLGRAPHPLGAEEHELVPVHRPRDRRGRAAAGRAVRVRRRGRAAHLRLRAEHRHADAAPLEGGGGRLPLLPRARPRAGRARAGAGRAAARRAAGAAGRRDPAHGRRRSASRTPGRSSPPTATPRTAGSSRAASPSARRSTSR